MGGAADTAPTNGKQQTIMGDLRRQIVDGHLAPGQRIPSNKKLQGIYGVTSVTISRAVAKLVEDGYLVARERSGVFVAGKLPHLTRFGVVFHSHPSRTADWNRMMDVLYREASKGIPDFDATFSLYHDILKGRRGDDYNRLVDDVRAQRIGGILFTSDPWHLWDTPLLEGHGLPLVAIMGRREQGHIYSLETESIAEKAIQHFASGGCKRVAQIISSTLSGDLDRKTWIEASARRHGLESRPEWTQYVDIAHPANATNVAHLLMSLPAQDRPDALLIADDNFVEFVELGVALAGVRAPEQLKVVAQTNFPSPISQQMEMLHIGYDMRELLTRAVEIMRAVRAGHAPDLVTTIRALTQDEFTQRWSGA